MKRNKTAFAAVLILSVLLCLLLSGCQSRNGTSEITCVDDLAGKRIGVLTGTIFDDTAKKFFPDCELVFADTGEEMAEALSRGEIDAYIIDEPVARALVNELPSQCILTNLIEDSYGFIFRKGDERRERLCAEMSEFIDTVKADGTLNEIDSVWFGSDDPSYSIDMDFTGENGTLRLYADLETGKPMLYTSEGQYKGYELDIAARFCHAYGYALKIVNVGFSDMLSAVSSGKADFGASSISITEEREAVFNFSVPHYTGGIAVVIKAHSVGLTSAAELSGKRVGVLIGSTYDSFVQDLVPDCELCYFSTAVDEQAALLAGDIAAFVEDENIFYQMKKHSDNLRILEKVRNETTGFIFRKDDPESDMLRRQFNEYLREITFNGKIYGFRNKWFYNDNSACTVDFSGLTGENGKIVFGLSTTAGGPFVMVRDGKYAGYEVDLMVDFCRLYGYELEISNMSFSELFAAVDSGVCDVCACYIFRTDEREKAVDFSDPDYTGSTVLITLSDEAQVSRVGIWESFRKTFLDDDHWKLFAGGIGVTLIITVLSMIFGTGMGFGAYILYRKKNRVFNGFLNVLMDIFEKTPAVVTLMVLYYIVFSNTAVSGLWVSVICFSVMFACSFVGNLQFAVQLVDPGQAEASLAMGLADTRMFICVILPQAARHFLPVYKSQVVSLLKDTAIVGYIAVQDLTAVGDIVRSGTYKAFFALISTALIYFLLAWLLTLAVRRIEIKADPMHRSPEEILNSIRGR